MTKPQIDVIGPPPLSKCHQAPVKVIPGDEGTSYWECTKCGQPCDLYVPDNRQLVSAPQTEQKIEEVLDWFYLGDEERYTPEAWAAHKAEAKAAIKAHVERAVLQARIEAVDTCIQLQLSTKTNDFDSLYDKLKNYKAKLRKGEV